MKIIMEFLIFPTSNSDKINWKNCSSSGNHDDVINISANKAIKAFNKKYGEKLQLDVDKVSQKAKDLFENKIKKLKVNSHKD